MHLVTGGAFQGKTTFAMEHFGLSESDICFCTEDKCPDLSVRSLAHYEKYVLYCIKNGISDYKSLPENIKVVIADDIFCGVVSIDPVERLWREECGRALTAIAGRSETFTRLFCGIPKRLK